MPNQDRTGPLGTGKLTGRGLGPCGGGRGMGFGRAGGWRWFLNQKNQKEMLVDYKSMLEEELKDIDQALSDIK